MTYYLFTHSLMQDIDEIIDEEMLSIDEMTDDEIEEMLSDLEESYFSLQQASWPFDIPPSRPSNA